MAQRVAVSLIIGVFFSAVLYTTNGCGGVTEPTFHFAAVNGIVTDANTGAPIANALVTVSQSGQGSVDIRTAADGRYSVGAFQPGTLRIDATATGYQPFTTSVHVVEGDNVVNVRLAPA